ncbi:MAG TPA: hypothetical protein VKU02_27725 [Gemmataceae bacterium]|nr:hypothetical protein [Gemmataceae bacterium]
MQRWKQALGLAVLVIVAGFLVRDSRSGLPQPGDTVTPHLESPIHWTSGTVGELGVRLYADAADGKRRCVLDFNAISWETSPVANIAFYQDDQPLHSLEVALSHRC